VKLKLVLCTLDSAVVPLSISPELRGCVTMHFLILPKLQLGVKRHPSYANNRFNGLS